uniref:Uncharacterized protein n=1 Tax=Oryza brachyantha TaxID=4533 RepID=J3MEZ2_ORYBR
MEASLMVVGPTPATPAHLPAASLSHNGRITATPSFLTPVAGDGLERSGACMGATNKPSIF